jgi:hypothetical protein
VTAVNGRVFASLLIYFENGQDDFFALDAVDGSILWSKDFGDVFSVNPPAYSAGKVYLQVGNHSTDTHLYTFDAVSGTLIDDGSHAAQWERYYAPTIVGGTAYINGGYYGGMYAFNFAEVPEQRWFKNLTQYDDWTPAADGIFAYAYTGHQYSVPAKLTVVRSLDGVEEFTIDDPNFDWLGWSMNLAPVLGGQNDVLVVQANRLLSFDLGTENIRYEIPDKFGGHRWNYYAGQPSVAKGVVYVINDGKLDARAQSDGSHLWTWTPPSPYRAEGTIIVTNDHALLVTIDDEHIVTPEEGSAIHAIDLTTHLSVWSHQFPPVGIFEVAVGGDIAWSEGRLYFAREDGVLTAFKLLNPYEQSSVVQFATTAYSVSEAAGPATVTLRRSGSGDGAVGVTVSSEDGTAVAGADYTAVNQVVSWADGDTADKTVQVAVINDSDTEGVEYLNLRLHSLTGPTSLGVFSRAQVTILDDEIDVLRFTSASTDVSEGGVSVSVLVTRNGPASGAVTVDWATANGTASAGSDYTAASDTLSWAAGDTTTKTITIDILDDGVDEDNETFTVSLSNPTPVENAIVGSPGVFTVTVIDNDGPRIQFGASSYQVDETAGSVDLTVKRIGNTAGAVSVDWATINGSATSGQDYTTGSGTLNWADGNGADKTINIAVLDDAATEGGENFEVVLSNVVGADIRLGQPDVATVSIADDEATEVRINTTIEFAQRRPRAVMDSVGTTVVVWDSWKQDGDQWGVFGQRLDASGAPLSGEFPVNATTSGNQTIPDVAVAAGGSFVVAWQADATVNTEIVARRFDSSASPLGGEFLVNSSASGTQTLPRVAIDGNGRFMVVWQGRDGSGAGVFGRVYGADGAPLGPEFVVNTTTASSQGSPDVAGFPTGGFVVAWESYDQDEASTDAVVGRRFGSTGTPLGGEILVNAAIAGNQSLPAVVVASGGRFLVAWEDDSGLDGAFGSIRGRWFDAGGGPLSGEFQINTYAAGDQRKPAVSAEPNGRAVVVWEGRNNQDGSEIGVFGRVLYDDGAFASPEVQLNSYTTESQDEPAVACSSAGWFLGVWRSEGQDGPPTGVEGVYGVSWPMPPPSLIFADGFESGDTTAWSAPARGLPCRPRRPRPRGEGRPRWRRCPPRHHSRSDG